MNFLECWWTDSYKTGHKFMLPEGSTLMYSNFTPRSGKLSNVPNNGKIVSFGQQMLVRKMKEDWDTNFFSRPIEEIDQFGKDMTDMLMLKEPYDVSHFKQLHKLGYLPLRIKAMPEGTLIPYKIPLTTIVNTQPLNNQVFDWLVNYLETILSAESWMACTSATTSYTLRQLGKEWILKTDPENMWFLDYQFHDFSMRGMNGKSGIINSGLGFATSSKGSDTLPVIPAARKYYDEKEVCINSVIATEHAIMCTLTGFFLQQLDGNWQEIGKLEVETFRELLRRFPTGILSIVSDTWDLWRVITEYMVILKDEILARDGKVVIRPDSGDPVDIICGEPDSGLPRHSVARVQKDKNKDFQFLYNLSTIIEDVDGNQRLHPKHKGVIELLWDIFGGTTSNNGYKQLSSKVGAIYGDSINYKRAEEIFKRLDAKGFASTNIVLGIGSYSLQYTTRDTHGMAQKATYVEIHDPISAANGAPDSVGIEIFKDPITDNGVKKSAKGLLRVDKIYASDSLGDLHFKGYELKDQCTWEEEEGGELQVIFEDGKLYNETTLTKIREKLRQTEKQLV